jgi:hypothetical protein
VEALRAVSKEFTPAIDGIYWNYRKKSQGHFGGDHDISALILITTMPFIEPDNVFQGFAA